GPGHCGTPDRRSAPDLQRDGTRVQGAVRSRADPRAHRVRFARHDPRHPGELADGGRAGPRDPGRARAPAQQPHLPPVRERGRVLRARGAHHRPHRTSFRQRHRHRRRRLRRDVLAASRGVGRGLPRVAKL
ncbi:MAG: hypothetical protein AVDCRST_MAG53-2734, partial [uncultured Solirubrobacteraceae bacterium]